MINIFEALNWLGAIDNCSYIDDETRRLISFARRFAPRDSKVQRILDRLRNTARSSGNPLEKAEILLYCAAIGSWRGGFPEAACDAMEAVISYDDDGHRHAVALWILGMTQWKMFQNHEAYANWAEARKIFNERQILFQNFPGEKAWYKNQLRRMNADLARHPEEIWTWLNWFEHSSLRPPTQQVIDCVQEKIRGHAYPNVYALMQDLQEANKRCKGGYEQAEIFLEFGLAIYEMRNTHFAIELLRKSVLHFYPGVGTYHKQVVARCMLGAVEWMDGRSHNQAEADWTRCIEEFEMLGQWANQDNNPTKKEWYTEHSVILCDALLDQRRKNPRPPGSDPRTDIPEENGAKPPPSTPSGRQTYSYEDLLNMVRRDQAVADRLIEYERKKAPTADRDELITRAIERLLRDRQ